MKVSFAKFPSLNKIQTLLTPLLTSVHNALETADDADDPDNVDNYNRVIGISKCEQKIANTHPNKCTHKPTHTQTSELDNYNKLSLWLSLKREMYPNILYYVLTKCQGANVLIRM